MWVIAWRVIQYFLGDKIIKWIFWTVLALFVSAYLEAGAAAQAIMAQPFGQWQLAAMEGSQVAASTGAASPGAASTGAAPPISGSVSAPIPSIAPPSAVASADSDHVAFALGVAHTWLGTPYLWGGCTKRGVDCSCFVQNVLASIGIHAPRNTLSQIQWAIPIRESELQPLDLVFFNNTCTGCGANPTHVGMYIGNGKMINAGDPVQIADINSPFWREHYAGSGRPH